MNLKEILEQKATRNNFNKNDFNKVLQNIKNSIKENKSIIEKMDQIDRQNFGKVQKIDIDQLLKIIDKNANQETENQKELKNIIVSYYGDPYITIELCIKSILSNNKIILAIEDFRLATNRILVEIVKNELKERKIYNTLYILNLLSINEIKENINNIDKILCIGNKSTYDFLKHKKIEQVEFLPYKNIEVYCDSENLEILQEKIYEYATINNIEIEIHDEIPSDFQKVIKKSNDVSSIVVLTEKEEIKDKLKNSTDIFVNDNSFLKKEFEIKKDKLL